MDDKKKRHQMIDRYGHPLGTPPELYKTATETKHKNIEEPRNLYRHEYGRISGSGSGSLHGSMHNLNQNNLIATFHNGPTVKQGVKHKYDVSAEHSIDFRGDFPSQYKKMEDITDDEQTDEYGYADDYRGEHKQNYPNDYRGYHNNTQDQFGSYQRMEHPGMERQRMEHPGMERQRMEHPGMERQGMERPGMEHPGMDRSGMDRIGMERPGMERPGMERPGMDRIGIERQIQGRIPHEGEQVFIDPKQYYESYQNSYHFDGNNEHPLYVNIKQYNCIRKRKMRRDFLDSLMKKTGKDGYLHESRHRHAMNRRRAPSGRFLTKEETAALHKEEL